ncbi:hypothetical protein [Microbispora sp. NPDC049633]|uniref:hypothetical protein n=1 Tax=Microbispora sp. NPDC049633 TaxID=3154355 RepID=UPI00343A6133
MNIALTVSTVLMGVGTVGVVAAAAISRLLGRSGRQMGADHVLRSEQSPYRLP